MTVLSENEHAVIRRCVDRQPKLFMRGQHEGYYVHSDVSDLIGVIARLTTALSEASAREGVLEGALRRQADNMAFALNRVELRGWTDKFAAELAEDRTALSRTTPT